MTYTLLEEQFFPYPWCQRLLRGLNEEARKKRIEITQLTNLEEKPSEFGCVLLIGATTFACSAVGVKIGNVFGNRFQSKAEFLGGLVLIGIGLKILIEHLFFGG